MAAINEIIEWAGGLPSWQADAVRRHLSSSEDALPDNEFEEVLAMALADLKLTETPPSPAPVPPIPEMFSGVRKASESISLESIGHVRNVNAIREDQTLTFAPTGITIIYGSNGAGKSGFARILKLACNARDKQEHILPNIYTAGRLSVPSATINLLVNGSPIPLAWRQGEASYPLLSQVSVFDARCARVIVDDRNALTYLPYGADVFEKVAKTAVRVRKAIEAKRVKLEPLQDSAILPETNAANCLLGLTHESTTASVDAATAWTPQDEADLATHEELVRTSKSEQLIAETARLKKIRGRLETAKATTSSLAREISELSDVQAQQRLDELAAAQRAYDIAVSERTTSEPLPGSASTSEWELLYNAAKDFSEKVAYPGTPFPNTGDDALCVLCQQPLEEEAKLRFRRFKDFMENRTAEALRQRKVALKAFADKYDELRPLEGDTLDVLCDEIAPFSTTAPTAIRDFHSALVTRKASAQETLAKGPQKDNRIAWPATPTAPVELIDTAIASLDARVEELRNAAKPDEYKALLRKGNELRSRKALNARKAGVLTHVARLKSDFQLKRAADSITTNAITARGTALIKANSTPALLGALNAEIAGLDASYIPLSMRAVGAAGETVHEMLLEGTQSGVKAKLTQVLSEGEQRVIALAGFFAELGLAEHPNPIVLDDPVSSLDHEFTKRIAARLAREGLKRQVVVFTHNIAFLMELQDAAEELRKAGTPVDLHVETLRRRGKVAGVGSAGLPWHAQTVPQRASHLDGLLGEIAPLHESDRELYNDRAANLYGLLREAWEACIEDDLLYAVVCRYRNSVKTQQLYEVEIEDADVRLIDLHMSRCSTWMTGHDTSKALSENRPPPSDVRADIEHLRATSKKFRGRRKAVRARRKP